MLFEVCSIGWLGILPKKRRRSQSDSSQSWKQNKLPTSPNLLGQLGYVLSDQVIALGVV